MKTFDFWEQNDLSRNKSLNPLIKKLLKKHFPTIKSAKYSKVEEDKLGVDIWITLKDGTKLGIDLKIRVEDLCRNKSPDVGLESISNGKVGWSLDPSKITDFVLFIYIDTERSHCYNFRLLRKVFKANLDRWEIQKEGCWVTEQKDKNSGKISECIFVNTKLLESKMIGEIIK